jgi:RimJ/RimL family protein N-acetyltransferase
MPNKRGAIAIVFIMFYNTPEVELGYVFDKSYWNMGLATEASKATLKYGFEEINRTYARSQKNNLVYQRKARRSGLLPPADFT